MRGVTTASSELLRIRASSSRGKLRLLGRQRGQNRGQFNPKDRAAFLPVVAVNSAGVLLHYAEANTQTQASAFADGLGGIEGIEYPMWLLQARAGIGEQND